MKNLSIDLSESGSFAERTPETPDRKRLSSRSKRQKSRYGRGHSSYKLAGSASIIQSSDYWRDIDRVASPRHRVQDSRLSRISGGRIEGFLVWCLKTWRSLQTFIFLALLGLINSLLALGFQSFARRSMQLRNSTLDVIQPFGWILYVVVSICLAAVAAFIVRYVSPLASGSGIPQMKSVFSGIYIHRLLSLRSLITKMVGLVCAWSAGLSIGKEGPFVHIAACIATLLMRLPPFQRYERSSSRRHGMLAVACAVGVVAALGCPFGGMIFAIEAVATFFLVSNIPRMFWATIAGTLAIRHVALDFDNNPLALYHTEFAVEAATGETYLQCIALGVLCGILSGIFIRFSTVVIRLRRQYFPFNEKTLIGFCRNSLPMLLAVVLAEALIVFVFRGSIPALNDQHSFISTLFDDESKLGSEALFSLALVLKFILTTICCSLPIPAGLFTPIFLLGGMFGRIFGEVVNAHADHDGDGHPSAQFTPAEFAVLGGAAMAGGTFRAVSTVVIVTELTGQLHIQLPVAVCVVAAYYVANRFAAPMYDVLTLVHGIPHLPALPHEKASKQVGDIMEKCDVTTCVTESFTLRDVAELLDYSEAMVFPIVSCKNKRLLLGEVQRRALEQALEKAAKTLRRGGSLPTSPRSPRSPRSDLDSLSGDLTPPHSNSSLRQHQHSSGGSLRSESSSFSSTKSNSRKKKRTTKLDNDQLDVPLMDQLGGEWQTGFHRVTLNTNNLKFCRLRFVVESDAGRKPLLSASADNRSPRRLFQRTLDDVEFGDTIEIPAMSISCFPPSAISVNDDEEKITDGADLAGGGKNKGELNHQVENQRKKMFPEKRQVSESEIGEGAIDGNDPMLLVESDAAPFMVSASALLSKVYMLFHMLRLSQIFVVQEGRLAGILTRERLIQVLEDYADGEDRR